MNMIKRIFKYLALAFLLFMIVIVMSITYLYLSADMLTPVYTADNTYELIDNGSYRKYGDNYLRQSENGLWELKVKGNSFERGEAIGKLSKDLLYYQEKVFVDQIKEIIPSDSYLKFLRFFIILFNRNLGENVPQEFREEIYGISLSCTDEYNMIGTPYERQLNYHSAHDLGHAMQDYMLVGCSSFAVWGENSVDSTLLIGRNFDFYMGDNFARNKQVAFYVPDTGYRFAAVGWPGMTGILSGMNEKGLTVTINAARSAMPTSSATPISVLTREILQYASTIDEAYDIARKRKTFVAESILIGSAKDGKAAIIEKSPDAMGLFQPESATRIICTNHYQSDTFRNDPDNLENIRTSDSPYRFQRLEELLDSNSPVGAEEAICMLRNHKGIDEQELGLANEMAINQFIAHHSVVFKPEQLLMWVSTHPWQCGKYVAYDLNHIFKDSVDFTKEISTAELAIPEDTFLLTPEYQNLLQYKQLTPLIRKHTRERKPLDELKLATYLSFNPKFFYTHEIVGDYYLSAGNTRLAVEHWSEALTLPIPKLAERNRIQNKIEEYK